ncbi:quinol oxidase subunit 2 [Collibacillus ludicampi]|uniref:Quinol oxidase subunit 2 n=1 Tax=Collibacillus ludicampi TaxID=2771369 RepID=A0AAV4LEU2_9BACL|nr:COX aromatic rich motif-containing protein [Collibacillus ludicampi]GIM46385.1 quinol oxidase subunit 2 [Collibacillus ludicampi]
MKQRRLLNFVKLAVLSALTAVFMAGCSPDEYMVLHPAGPVARTEYDLIVLSTILVAIVIIPVMAILAYIVYRYRDVPGNKAPYMPEWADSKVLEIIWWGIPIVIILLLAVPTAKTTFALTKPPVQDVKPVTIQVTSLNWKWLFTYPDQKVATVNYVEIPAGVPVQFVLTSDSPMNSFWIPQLGGQEYTMPGMAMRLWLQADKPGEYFGSGASFTGEGFAHMQFKVIAKPQSEFNAWVTQAKQTSPGLTKDGYEKLKQPSVLSNTLTYSSYPQGLFEEIVDKNGGEYMNHDFMGNEQKDQSGNMNHDMQNHQMSDSMSH